VNETKKNFKEREILRLSESPFEYILNHHQIGSLFLLLRNSLSIFFKLDDDDTRDCCLDEVQTLLCLSVNGSRDTISVLNLDWIDFQFVVIENIEHSLVENRVENRSFVVLDERVSLLVVENNLADFFECDLLKTVLTLLGKCAKVGKIVETNNRNEESCVAD